MHSISVKLPSSKGYTMAGTLDMPDTKPVAYALFSHCFAGNRFTPAAARTSKWLAEHGIACLRFDYPGLGQSEGSFGDTCFTENVADLIAANNWLTENYEAPQLLIGHSLGGAMALNAGGQLKNIKAVATMGAPFDPAHAVLHFADKIGEVDQEGAVPVELGGRKLLMTRKYLEDLAEINPEVYIPQLRKPLLILHSPIDQTVGIDSAQKIFLVARYPKSLVAMDKADHLFTREGAAQRCAEQIHTWVQQYLTPAEGSIYDGHLSEFEAEATSTQASKFSDAIIAGPSRISADRPRSRGGKDTGHSPYSLLVSSLAADTSQAIREAATSQRIRLESVHVAVEFNQEDQSLTRKITLVPELSDDQRASVLAAAQDSPITSLLRNAVQIHDV